MSVRQQTDLEFLQNVTGWPVMLQLPFLDPGPPFLAVYGTYYSALDRDDEEAIVATVIIKLPPRQ